jgi:hypothetical protein
VVKPAGLSEFMEAVKKLGIFWAAINELPVPKRADPVVWENHDLHLGREKSGNGIPDPYSARGG